MLAENDFLVALKLRFQSPLIVDLIYGYLCDLWNEHISASRDAFCRLNKIEFPKPRDIQINMMPFVLGDKASIPKGYQQYWPLICECLIRMDESAVKRGPKGFTVDSDRASMKKIGYLTIHESWCEKGKSQRRGGLHTDSNPPGNLEPASLYRNYQWGGGCTTTMKNGIYMANNVNNSCKIWPNLLENPGSVQGMFGNLEHLRPLLSPSSMMKRNTLYWLTDCTPHEGLPLQRRTYRQFFRLVSSKLSIWFDCSSTKNPLGFVPPKTTYVYQGNKFGKTLKMEYSPSEELSRMLAHYVKFHETDRLLKDDNADDNLNESDQKIGELSDESELQEYQIKRKQDCCTPS